ncbi:MAG: LptF/LptG family permease [Vampirovibrionales bacterium]
MVHVQPSLNASSVSLRGGFSNLFAWGWSTLDRYILKECFVELCIGILLFTLIGFFSNTFLDFLQDVRKYGIPSDIAAYLLWLQIPSIVVLVMPASTFFACMMVLQRLNQHRELMALQTLGVSPGRMIRPLLLIGLTVASLSYGLTNYWVPDSYKQVLEIKSWLLEKGPRPTDSQHFILSDFNDKHQLEQLLYLGHVKGNRVENVLLMTLNDHQDTRLLHAASADWGDKNWQIQKANVYFLPQASGTVVSNHLGVLEIPNPVKMFHKTTQQDQSVFRKQEILNKPSFDKLGRIVFTALSFQDMWDIIQVWQQRQGTLPAKFYLKMWEKITLPLTTLALVVLALPLAMSAPRKRRDIGMVVAVLGILGFYVLRALVFSWAESTLWLNATGISFAAWVPFMVMLFTGMTLLWWKSKPAK